MARNGCAAGFIFVEQGAEGTGNAMKELLDQLSRFTQTQSIWVYVFIFCGKVLEVTVSTLRIVLINRGIRLVGSLIAIIEVTLWVLIVSTVLASVQSDPLKIVVYAVAFGLGNFLGSLLDEALAFGLASIQVVVPDAAIAHELAAILRKKGFGITVMGAQGIDDQNRYMLLLMIRRKSLKEALQTITGACNNAVITVTDVKAQKGGYLRNQPTHGHFSLRKGK